MQIKAGKEFQRLETLLQKLNLTISERGLGIYNCRECLRRVILVFSTEGGNKLLSLSVNFYFININVVRYLLIAIS